MTRVSHESERFAGRLSVRICLFFAVLWIGRGPQSAQGADLLYVSLADNRIVTYDVTLLSASAVQASFGVFASTGLNDPRGIAFDASGNLYAVSNADNKVIRFNSSGTPTTFATTGMDSPQGLAISPSGTVYVANNLGNTITRFDSAGVSSTFANANLNAPFGIAFDTDGNLYAANSGNNTITRFTSSGTASTFANTKLSIPGGVAFDAAGNLYASNIGDDTISRFNSAGTGTTFANAGMDGPLGMAFDSLGNLYVSNVETISKYNSSGVFQFAWTTPAEPIYLTARNVVPEPSTYILCSIATGVIALHARRRRSAKLPG